MKHPARIMLLTAALLLSVYVGSYFVCVHVAFWAGSGIVNQAAPAYRFFPESAHWVPAVYRPLHNLDRTYLRPSNWERQVMTTQPPIVFQ